MVIFSPEKYYDFILEHRAHVLENTQIIKTELEDIKNNYFYRYWDSMQKIRTDINWINSKEWIKQVPQCFSQWYNPIVMSKVFFIQHAHKENFFNTDKFIWIDAGITQHIPTDFINESSIINMAKKIESVLFTSFDYIGDEIHGFKYDGYKKYTDITPDWLCRATIFGSHANCLDTFVSDYEFLLADTLNRGYMGTEESIYTLLTCINPKFYVRYHTKNESMPKSFLNYMKNLS
jgi:hypothetical protein